MKLNIWHPILITLITLWSLGTEEKRTELLDGNPILWVILFTCLVSWFVYFMQLHKRKKLKKK